MIDNTHGDGILPVAHPRANELDLYRMKKLTRLYTLECCCKAQAVIRRGELKKADVPQERWMLDETYADWLRKAAEAKSQWNQWALFSHDQLARRKDKEDTL